VIELTPQAVDQASNRLRAVWLEARRAPAGSGVEPECLHTWLRRMAKEALDVDDRTDGGKYRHAGMKFGLIPMAGDRTNRWLLRSVERVR
jgi:hypothetical protein